VFTASSHPYATAVLKFLDPYNQYISGLLSRSNCMQTKNGFFIKDLRIIRNRDLKDLIIVDNLAHSFGFQIENGVPILEWHSGEDSELYYLKNYLMEAANAVDVREFNTQNLRLGILASKEPEELGI
jgi:CTD small phosphatase-like protein 2